MPMVPLGVALTEALRGAAGVRLYTRLKVVQLAGRVYPVRALAEIFDRHEQSVRSYLHADRAGGRAALPDAPRSGRPPKLPTAYARGEESRAAWQRLLDQRPSTIPALETPSHVWTLGLLARYMRVAHPPTRCSWPNPPSLARSRGPGSGGGGPSGPSGPT